MSAPNFHNKNANYMQYMFGWKRKIIINTKEYSYSS